MNFFVFCQRWLESHAPVVEKNHLMKSKMRILVLDHVSSSGVKILQSEASWDVKESGPLAEGDLIKAIAETDALVVRSQTKVTRKAIEAAQRLRVVGRAGVGVDNVDVEAATQRGIVVMNTPSGNTISTAEHTFSMMLALARSIPQAHASMKDGKWDRKSFQGVELFNKTLGIVGLGRIGGEVARRAIAFGMRVLAYDPFVALARAKSLQVEPVELNDLLERADWITVHMPLSDETRSMINREALARTKPGVRILNCARGGIVDEVALAEALTSGHVAGAAFDVYLKEPPPADFPLRKFPNVILTPHLGASTAEAQESVGIEIAEAIRNFLLNGEVQNAVNMPNVNAKVLAVLRPHLSLAEKLGRILSQLAPAHVEELTITYAGQVSELNTQPVTRSLIKGFLERISGRGVNEVNALNVAASLGMKVQETRTASVSDYSELIQLVARAGKEEASIAGTFFGSTNNPRVARINGFPVEAAPVKVLCIMENLDKPGIIGWVGTIFGKHGVNIANMSLARDREGGNALTVLHLDDVPDERIIAEITPNPAIKWVKVVKVC